MSGDLVDESGVEVIVPEPQGRWREVLNELQDLEGEAREAAGEAATIAAEIGRLEHRRNLQQAVASRNRQMIPGIYSRQREALAGELDAHDPAMPTDELLAVAARLDPPHELFNSTGEPTLASGAELVEVRERRVAQVMRLNAAVRPGVSTIVAGLGTYVGAFPRTAGLSFGHVVERPLNRGRDDHFTVGIGTQRPWRLREVGRVSYEPDEAKGVKWNVDPVLQVVSGAAECRSFVSTEIVSIIGQLRHLEGPIGDALTVLEGTRSLDNANVVHELEYQQAYSRQALANLVVAADALGIHLYQDGLLSADNLEAARAQLLEHIIDLANSHYFQRQHGDMRVVGRAYRALFGPDDHHAAAQALATRSYTEYRGRGELRHNWAQVFDILNQVFGYDQPQLHSVLRDGQPLAPVE